MALPRYNPGETRLNISGQVAGLQAQSNTWSTLSQKLDQFRNVGYQELGQQRAVEAEQQAYKDQLENKPFHEESVYTIYGQAYNSTRKATYTAQTELDFQAKSASLAEQFADDPESYKNMQIDENGTITKCD